jgi:predicted lipid-binding transport protein (Tim44 family)/uncharacterized membrane protein YebE (DUF533 family)/DNA-directed RNA polymerase subunit RPC12/RpoP
MGLRRLAIVPLLLLGALLFLSPPAFGRAGGGQHYSAPSRSSSGGGSRSSGGSYSGGSWSSPSGGGGFYVPMGGGRPMSRGDFSFLVTVIIIVLIVVLVVYMINNRTQQNSWQETSFEVQRLDEQRLRPAEDVENALAALKQDDPAFSEDAFFERTKKVFLDIQEAWFQRNLDTVRLYMSDGLYRRFTTLLSLMQLENQRNGLADAVVLSARLMEVTRTNAFDCLTVRIHASMRDVDVPASDSDEQARRKAKASGVEDFTELWTFVRRRDAKTKSEYDTSQGKCPNCGAPFTGGAANKCEYCGSIINSGNYDWVLCEITQPSEYLPHDRSAAGVDALLARDPDAAAEVLQDRGLLLFWKWLECWAFADARRLQKLALPEAVAGFESEIGDMKKRGQAFVVKVPAVGGTRIAAVELDDGGFDRAHVEIRWSAVTGVGRISSSANPQSFRSIVTMVRASDARTDRGVGLSNERCGNCGAPLSNSDSTKCDYCGHDLASATKEWQLSSVVPIEQWRRPSTASRPRTQAFATSGERRRLMSVLVAVAKADGIIEPRELRLLRDCALRWHIAWSEVQAMLDGQIEDAFGTLQPKSPDEARSFLEQMVAAARVDGTIDRRERALILEAAEHLGVSKATVEELLRS